MQGFHTYKFKDLKGLRNVNGIETASLPSDLSKSIWFCITISLLSSIYNPCFPSKLGKASQSYILNLLKSKSANRNTLDNAVNQGRIRLIKKNYLFSDCCSFNFLFHLSHSVHLLSQAVLSSIKSNSSNWQPSHYSRCINMCFLHILGSGKCIFKDSMHLIFYLSHLNAKLIISTLEMDTPFCKPQFRWVSVTFRFIKIGIYIFTAPAFPSISLTNLAQKAAVSQ